MANKQYLIELAVRDDKLKSSLKKSLESSEIQKTLGILGEGITEHLEKDIDKAIAMAYSYKDFETIMNKMGYELTNRYGKLSVRGQNFKKNIRIIRAFGDDYSIANIEKELIEIFVKGLGSAEKIST